MPHHGSRMKSFAVALGYLRVSTEDQNLGVDAQRTACAAWSKANGIKILGWFEDRCSGATPYKDRPAWTKVTRAVTDLDHTVDFVVAARRDRFSRDVLNMNLMEAELRAKGVRLVAATGSMSLEETPEGTLQNDMVDAFAAYERRLISIRTKLALEALRAQGVKLGAPGYSGDHLARVKKFLDKKKTWAQITKELNDAGVLTVRGKKWTAGAVRYVAEKLV